jgi:plastocyanin
MTGGLVRGTIATLCVSLPAFGCGDSGGPTTENASVEIVDNAFSPSSVRVARGATVTWTWKGANTHSVAGPFEGRDFNSGDHTAAEGFTASYEFTTTGTYEYVCGFHGGSMRGTVIVE